MIGLVENGVLICEPVGMISKVPESREEVLVESVSVFGVCSIVGVIAGDDLSLGKNHPEGSRACLLPVRCASVSVCRESKFRAGS